MVRRQAAPPLTLTPFPVLGEGVSNPAGAPQPIGAAVLRPATTACGSWQIRYFHAFAASMGLFMLGAMKHRQSSVGEQGSAAVAEQGWTAIVEGA